MTTALSLSQVTKRFGSAVAVDGVDLEVPSGCIQGFLGPNGAGKTTILRMVMSILMPNSGSLSVLGNTTPEAVKDRLGYLPEEKGLYKKMRVGEMLTYFGRLKGLSWSESRRRGEALLQQHGLGDRRKSKCEELSKGLGQKVQVLGTLIHEPELVILDEPFSGLDPVNVEMVRDLVLELKRQGRTVIFSTHVMEQAEQICDRIFLINRGQKVLDGSLAEVKSTGDQAIRLDYDGDGSILKQLPGVTRLNDAGKTAELFLDPGQDPQQLLAHLVGKIVIRRFDLREPSLHEIFVRAVKGDVDE